MSRHSCHWPNAFVSLTTECDLNSVECIRVIDQMHSCHWPQSVIYTQSDAFVSLTKMHWCHWPSPKEIQKSLRLGIRVIDQMHSCHWPNAFVSLTTECDLNSVECIRVIDQMHSCHWPQSVIYTQSDAFVSLTKMHWCHWPSPKEIQKSLRLGIRVIDQMHSCHWPNAFVSLTTECDLHSVTCIRVIDQNALVSLTVL